MGNVRHGALELGETPSEGEEHRTTSGVRRVTPRQDQDREEVRRLYRQLSEGTLDLSPPSVPPMLGAKRPAKVTRRYDVKATAAPRTQGVLLRTNGALNGQLHSLPAGELLLGRSPAAALQVDDEGVSRRHAILRRSKHHYSIQDLDSSNGTFVQGRRVKRAQLKDGDLVQFGPRATFRFRMMDSEREKTLKRLFSQNTLDPLTQVLNRRAFEERLTGEVAYAMRHQTALSLVLLDPDHLDDLNSCHGTDIGDTLLKTVAKVTQSRLRAEDVLGRYQGATFALLLRGIPLAGAALVADRIRKTLAGTVLPVGSENIGFTVSAGCSALEHPQPIDSAVLFGQAEERLACAKRHGRNHVVDD